MATMTREQMDQVVADHFKYEASNDVEGVLATLTDDIVHDVVGFPGSPLHGRDSVRPFYQALYEALSGEEVTPLNRLYGDDMMVDDAIWAGRVEGQFLGLEGNGRRVSFRELHVFEFSDGLISKENVWMDVGAILQQLQPPTGR